MQLEILFGVIISVVVKTTVEVIELLNVHKKSHKNCNEKATKPSLGRTHETY